MFESQYWFDYDDSPFTADENMTLETGILYQINKTYFETRDVGLTTGMFMTCSKVVIFKMYF